MSPGRFLPMALVAAALSFGCGARSGLDCFGERCSNGGPDDDGDAFMPPDELPPGRPPVGSTPPRDEPLVPDQSRPPEQFPVDTPIDPSRGRLCENGGTVRGSLSVTDRSSLLALQGCEIIDGDLIIQDVPAADLDALSSLRQVSGTLMLSQYSGSLRGLESLESVNNLTLERIGASTLAPLQNLLQIGGFTPTGGRLVVSQSNNLIDLAGMPAFAGLQHVELSGNSALEQVVGLGQVEELTTLRIFDNPSLTSVGFDRLQRADVIEIQIAALTRIDGLQSLREVSSLSLMNLSGLGEVNLPQLETVGVFYLENTAVASLAGLTGLRALSQAVIQNNGDLLEVDRLGPLETLNELSVINNRSLNHLPDFPGLVTLGQLHLRDNAALATGPGFPGVTEAGTILIAENPALALVAGFASLQRARSIDISRNASLVAVDFGTLSGARTVRVTCNRALDESSLAPLLGIDATVDVWGNQGSPTPCP